MNQIEQFAEILTNIADEKDFIIISVDSFSSFSLLNFQNKYPNRVIEMGIAELSAIGVAYGISLTNRKVFIVGFSSFLILRGLEALRSFLSYQNANVTIIGGMSGLSHAEDGYMHQSYDDLGILSSLPNLKIYTPSDYKSLELTIKRVMDEKAPSFIRMYRLPIDLEKWKIKGNWKKIKKRKYNNSKITIFSFGYLLKECLIASELLENNNIMSDVIEILQFSPLDEEMIIKAIKNSKYIVTVEDHLTKTGLADQLMKICYKAGIKSENFITIGANNEWIGQSGTVDELIDSIGANHNKIYDTIYKFFMGRNEL